MRSKVMLLLFIFLVSLNSSNAIELDSFRTNRGETVSSKEEKRDDDEDTKKYKKILGRKKILKKEISYRKRYHKTLLSEYNRDFDDKYLELISQNGLIINQLEKYYKSKFVKEKA